METWSQGSLHAGTVTNAYARLGKELLGAERDLDALWKRASKRGGKAARMAPGVFNRFARLQNQLMELDARMGILPERFKPVGSYATLVRAEGRALRKLRLRMRTAPSITMPFFFAFNPDKFWFKLTWTLGVDGITAEVREFFERFHGNIIAEIRQALRTGNRARFRRALTRLLTILRSKQFEEWLIRKIGPRLAKKALKQLAVRLIPVVGWLFMAGMIVAALIGQFFID
jgi:hypothetical protein